MGHWAMLFHSPIVHGARIGWVTAAHVDYSAFLSFGTWKDAATYNWGTASFRWFKGALGGAIMGAGFGQWLS